jgi:crotonobetainyl-CoA:carnitine CoA-transferase CaiB-like acyl-CoA transferase
MRLVEGPPQLQLGARVVLQGRRWGIPQRVVSEVTAWDPPTSFTDAQVEGPFRRWVHTHSFEAVPEGTRVLDEIFATRTYDEWKDVLADVKGVWAPVQTGLDLHDDVQVQANGYLGDAVSVQGTPFQLVTNPTQFNEERTMITRAPELGEHTDDVLRSIGLDDEAIIQLKIDDAIL